MKPHTRGLLLVIAAGSGTGKTTVCKTLLEELPGSALSVSYTTRPARCNEVDGVHYHFVSSEDFEQMIEQQELLEWAQVHGNYYGTGKQTTMELLEQGQHVLLDIDVQGAHSIRKLFGKDAVLCFLLPPSWDVMLSRLRGRATETEESIQRRLETARTELPTASSFDYILVNDEIDQTVSDIIAICQAEQVRAQRMKGTLQQLLAQIPDHP